MKILLDCTVDTDYGQFSLEWGSHMWDGESDLFYANQQNGLVGAVVPDVVFVHLARRSGGSPVRVELWAEPATADHRWEDCVEVSIAVPPGADVRWTGFAGETGGAIDLPAGDFRLRVSANGRDAGRDGEFEQEAVDSYLLQLWPSPPASDEVVRVGSEDAAYWHRTYGNQGIEKRTASGRGRIFSFVRFVTSVRAFIRRGRPE